MEGRIVNSDLPTYLINLDFQAFVMHTRSSKIDIFKDMGEGTLAESFQNKFQSVSSLLLEILNYTPKFKTFHWKEPDVMLLEICNNPENWDN